MFGQLRIFTENTENILKKGHDDDAIMTIHESVASPKWCCYYLLQQYINSRNVY